MDYDRPNFVITDFIIFGITVSISIGIGIFYALSGGKQKTTAEYLVGNRKMSIFPVALSMMASFESSIMMLGFPAEIYVYGIMYWLYTIGYAGAVLLTTLLSVPLVHPLRIKSVYEYLELRYKGRTVRLLGTTIGMLFYVFYMGIVLYGPGTALEATTNMPFWVSVVIVATTSVIYTSIGGIKAVVWTDAFQSLLMFIGISSVIIQGTMLAGGPTQVFKSNAENGRLHLFNFDPDPTVRHTFWGLVLAAGLRNTHMSFNQSTVQRISSIATPQSAKRMMYITAAITFVILALVTLAGVVAYGYYSVIGCDPLTYGQITNPNQILPFMVLDIFRNIPGMAGLFMASLFSASLSTLSSGLSSLSAMTVEDYVKPSFKTLSDNQLTVIAKSSVPIYGFLVVCISIMIAKIPGPLSEISVSVLSAMYGPTAGLFLYSVYFPWATTKGALVGTITAVLLSSWLSLGQNLSSSLQKTPWATMPPVNQCLVYQNTTFTNFTFPIVTPSNGTTETMIDSVPHGLDKYYSLSYQWIGLLGIIYCIFIAIVTSLIEGMPKSADVDVRYVLPFFDQFFPFFPTKLRKFLYLGVQFEQREEWLRSVYNRTKDNKEELEIPGENTQKPDNVLLLVDVQKCNENDIDFKSGR